MNAELEELEQEDLDEQMLNIGGTAAPELPSVPDTDLPEPSNLYYNFHIILIYFNVF